MKELVLIALTATLLGLFGCVKFEKNAPTGDVLRPFKHKKGRTVHPEITTDLISKLKDDELEQAVFENLQVSMKNDTRDEAEKVKSLNAGQRAIYVTWIVEEEVYNGGLDRFYSGPKSVLSDMTEEAFLRIGAPKYGNLIKEANSMYKGTSKPNIDALEELDDKFDALYDTENLDELKIKYIRAHPDEFVKQAQ